jgi:hypothetical protein
MRPQFNKHRVEPALVIGADLLPHRIGRLGTCSIEPGKPLFVLFPLLQQVIYLRQGGIGISHREPSQ